MRRRVRAGFEPPAYIASLIQSINDGARYADFSDSEFFDADLVVADVRGAYLMGSQMQGADLSGAHLQGASLYEAQMQGAELVSAQMQGANLEGAQMQGANLWLARMQGANLRNARMQGAYLRDAQMQGADLRGAGLWQVEFDETSNLSLADLRGINSKPIADEDLEKSLEARSFDRVKEALRLRLNPQVWPKVTVEPDMPALVDARNHPCFANIEEHLTTDEKTYDAMLAGYLADLARSDADVAPGIVRRVLPQRVGFHDNAERTERARSLWPDLARRLLAAEKEGAFKLDISFENRKTLEELAAKAPAPPL